MKYLVIGAGGTGGALGAHLARGGMDVTLIARGAHLEAIQARGLQVVRPADTFTVDPISATDTEHYDDTPDAVFVCVKGYSLGGLVPFLRRIVSKDTVVIPVLNIYGTGGALQEKLPGTLVTDGCIYIASEIEAPGRILMRGDIFRVVFGVRRPEEFRPVLRQIEQDLRACGIDGLLSENIQRDALMKFAYVSPQGACGVYYDVPAGEIQRPGVFRDCFAALVGEIVRLAEAMGIRFEEDLVQRNLAILDALEPEVTTSMQKDLKAGGPSELDGLVYEVLRMGERYGAPLPEYRKIAEELKRRGLK